MAKRRNDDDEIKNLTVLGKEASQAIDEAMREYHASYFASSNSRHLPTPPGISPMGSGSDYHYRTEAEYFRMMERARFLDRDNMVAGQGVTRLVANVVQEGFAIDPDTGDEGLDAELVDRWWEWAETPDLCDLEGERCWQDFEQAALRATIVDGDLCPLLTNRGAIQWKEGHHLRNPFGIFNSDRIVHGVEMDANRKRIAYHITADEINPIRGTLPTSNFRRIPARDSEGFRNVLHLYDPKRLTQTRGVTAFAPSVVPTQYHEDMQFATLLKAKVASFIAIFRQYDVDASTGSPRKAGSRTTEDRDDGSSRVVERTGLAQTIKGDPGEKLQGFAPNIPNPEFFPHVSLVLSIIAVNLDLPLVVFLLDPSRTNFSSWRGAIDQSRMRFRQRQDWLRRSFHEPVWKWKVREWLRTDPAMRNLPSTVNPYGHNWKRPKWPYIEPLKDAQADDLRISRNLESPTIVHGERGRDWRDVSREIVRDRSLHIRNAMTEAARINGEYPGSGVTWRDLAGDWRDAKIAPQGPEDSSDASGGDPGVSSGA